MGVGPGARGGCALWVFFPLPSTKVLQRDQGSCVLPVFVAPGPYRGAWVDCEVLEGGEGEGVTLGLCQGCAWRRSPQS